MSKRYGMRTEISVSNMDELYPVICQQIEFELPIKAYREGLGLTGKISHHKEIALVFDQETGEPYEVCVVLSAADVQELVVRGE
jgi:hypothetical protein